MTARFGRPLSPRSSTSPPRPDGAAPVARVEDDARAPDAADGGAGDGGDAGPGRRSGLKLRDPAQSERARKRLNAANTNTPLLDALMTHPGIAVDREAFRAAMTELVEFHRSVTSRVIGDLHPDGDVRPGNVARISNATAELVGSVWTRSQGRLEKSADEVAAIYLDWIRMQGPLPDPGYGDTADNDLERRISLSQALSKTSDTQTALRDLPDATRRLFLSDLPLNAFVGRLHTLVDAHARNIAGEIAEEDDPKGALITYKSAVGNVGRLTATLLRTRYRDLSAELRAMDKPRRREYLDNLPRYEEGRLMREVRRALAWCLRSAYGLDLVPEHPERMEELGGDAEAPAKGDTASESAESPFETA